MEKPITNSTVPQRQLRHTEHTASSGVRLRAQFPVHSLPSRAVLSLCSAKNTTTLTMLLEQHRQPR